MQNVLLRLRKVRGRWPALAGLALMACGGDDTTSPTEVTLGQTTFVVLVNPTKNDANQVDVPQPGTARSGVTVAVAGGPSVQTDANGVAVLAPVTAGAKTLSFSGSGAGGQLSASIADKDLREVAVASTSSASSEMANVQYAFGGTVVEVTSSMTIQQVNAELAKSNLIVFFRSGTYTGDLTFSGSDVTLFGQGASGGTVTLNGNVTVEGSRNRMRGVRITGNMSVPGSNFGMSFSRVAGSFQMDGSSGVLLNNAICGTVTIKGSGAKLLGNAGLAPIAAPSGGC
ncbi:MAG: hypothetical protein HY560_09210 [Gemmatimonadetes bacterium]|nr:hypothetical protein [Gemmatimonadota bacterium]